MGCIERPYYVAQHSTDGPYVCGPCLTGMCGPYSGAIHLAAMANSNSIADIAVAYANNGYFEGYAQAQRDMRKAMGIKE